jgi:hypothetical protein
VGTNESSKVRSLAAGWCAVDMGWPHTRQAGFPVTGAALVKVPPRPFKAGLADNNPSTNLDQGLYGAWGSSGWLAGHGEDPNVLAPGAVPLD